MSIINDALKKAGTEKQKFGTHERINVALETERKRSGLNWGPIFVVLVLVLITTPIVAPLFSTPFKKTSSYTTAPTLRQTLPLPGTQPATLLASSAAGASASRKAQFMVEEYPLKSMAPLASAAPNWALTGIVFAPDGSYSIINDKIVRVGENIQGAKLEKIASNEVTLDYQGQKITLQAAH